MDNEEKLQDMSAFGPFAICKEAFRLLRAHARLYFWSLQYAVLIPWSVSVTLTSFLFYAAGNAGPGPESNSVPSAGGPSSSSPYLIGALQSGQWSAVGTAMLLEFLVLMIGIPLAAAILTSPVVYSAGLVCAGKPASLSDALQAISLFWKRVVITNLALFVILYGTSFLVTVVAACLVFAVFHDQTFVILLSTFVASVTVVILAFIFLLAHLVPILGDGSGFDALWKGRKLLQGKRLVAVGVIILSSLVYPISFLIGKAFQSQALIDPWSFRVLIIGLLQIVYSSLVTPWPVMCQVVLYMSCKASHGENIANSISPVEGYQQVDTLGFADTEANV